MFAARFALCSNMQQLTYKLAPEVQPSSYTFMLFNHCSKENVQEHELFLRKDVQTI
jgi:hypothetical protein